jgi:hypothetical protein
MAEKEKDKTSSYSDTVDQITGFFTDHFKKLGKLPQGDQTVEEIMNDIRVGSELKRILAIPDRLSYLAKGIISNTVKDEAKVAMLNMVCLVKALLSSEANDDSVDRSVDSVVDSELNNLLEILGLTLESDEKNVKIDKKNRVVKIGD